MNTVVSVLLLIVCSSFKNTSEYVIANYLLENLYHICDMSNAKTANTSDSSNVLLYAGILMIGLVVATLAFLMRKRHN